MQRPCANLEGIRSRRWFSAESSTATCSRGFKGLAKVPLGDKAACVAEGAQHHGATPGIGRSPPSPSPGWNAEQFTQCSSWAIVTSSDGHGYQEASRKATAPAYDAFYQRFGQDARDFVETIRKR